MIQEWKIREKLRLWSRYLQAALLIKDWEIVAQAEKEISELWEELGGSDYSAITNGSDNTRIQIAQRLNKEKQKPKNELESKLDGWE
jgi:hypothetical protein